MIRVKADHANKKVFFGIDNATDDHRYAIRNAAYEIGVISKRAARKRIADKNKNGKTYRIGSKVHRASAGDEAPALFTGNLHRSVDFDVRSWNQMELGYKILYGKFLEDGTKFMARRPNLRNVADDMTQEFINSMVRYFRK